MTSFAVTNARGVGPPKIHAAVVVRPLTRRHLPAAGFVSRSRQQFQTNVASEQQTAQDLCGGAEVASVGFKLLRRSQLVPKSRGPLRGLPLRGAHLPGLPFCFSKKLGKDC